MLIVFSLSFTWLIFLFFHLSSCVVFCVHNPCSKMRIHCKKNQFCFLFAFSLNLLECIWWCHWVMELFTPSDKVPSSSFFCRIAVEAVPQLHVMPEGLYDVYHTDEASLIWSKNKKNEETVKRIWKKAMREETVSRGKMVCKKFTWLETNHDISWLSYIFFSSHFLSQQI